MPDRLQVWLRDLHVADVERRRRSDARLWLTYTPEARERWPQNAPVVSCSLPVGRRPLAALPFLVGLLPEGDALAALAARARTSVVDTFGLLERYGGDIAGALVIGRDRPDEGRYGLERYDADALDEEVDGLDRNPLGVRDDSSLSLAGLQNKLLLVRDGGEWSRPINGRPSTHILKVEDRRFPGLATAEADCLMLARAARLGGSDAAVHELAGVPCLITERYDRVLRADGSLVRLHQEDLCQAVGVIGTDNGGRRKYQRRGGGGPGLRDAARLLDAHAVDPGTELARLASIVAFTVAIGNADGHAKNLAFLHDTDTTIRLAPLYDTVPTVLWPKLTRECSMSVNGAFGIDELTLDDVADEAASWGFDRDVAAEAAVETVTRVAQAAASIALEPLAQVVAARCEALLHGRSAGAPS